MPLSTGQILDKRYRIVKLLGQGGFMPNEEQKANSNHSTQAWNLKEW
jgi:hypothetical protein